MTALIGDIYYETINWRKQRKLDLKAETEETGIFDARWLKQKYQKQPVFAVAYASPSFQILSLNKDDGCKAMSLVGSSLCVI